MHDYLLVWYFESSLINSKFNDELENYRMAFGPLEDKYM